MTRRGKKKAAMAVGHSILVIAYHLLERGNTYEELSSRYFDEGGRQVVERRLEGMGYNVTVQPAA